MHVKPEQRSRIRIGVEIVVSGGIPERFLDGLQYLVTVMLERTFRRPPAPHNLQSGVVAVRMYAEQTTTWPQTLRQRRDNFGRLEFERRARAIGLGGHDEIVIRRRAAAPRDDGIEQEAVVLAVDDKHRRTLINVVEIGRAHV